MKNKKLNLQLAFRHRNVIVGLEEYSKYAAYSISNLTRRAYRHGCFNSDNGVPMETPIFAHWDPITVRVYIFDTLSNKKLTKFFNKVGNNITVLSQDLDMDAEVVRTKVIRGVLTQMDIGSYSWKDDEPVEMTFEIQPITVDFI